MWANIPLISSMPEAASMLCHDSQISHARKPQKTIKEMTELENQQASWEFLNELILSSQFHHQTLPNQIPYPTNT